MATKTKLENTHRIVLTRPLYVGVGVTDFAVEAVRGLVSDAQARANRAQKRLEDLDAAELREQATRRVNERVEAFGKAAEETQEAAEKRISELQDEVRSIPTRISDFVVGNVEAATDVYVDLAKRGESLVTRVRRQESTQDTVRNARTTKAKAKTTRTQAKKTAPTRSRRSPSRGRGDREDRQDRGQVDPDHRQEGGHLHQVDRQGRRHQDRQHREDRGQEDGRHGDQVARHQQRQGHADVGPQDGRERDQGRLRGRRQGRRLTLAILRPRS